MTKKEFKKTVNSVKVKTWEWEETEEMTCWQLKDCTKLFVNLNGAGYYS